MPEHQEGAGAPAIRRMPVKTAVVRLDGDYAGWEATVRVNPRLSIYDELVGGDLAQTQQVLAALLRAWNFVDEEGEPLPTTLDGVKSLPADLTRDLLVKVQEAITRLP